MASGSFSEVWGCGRLGQPAGDWNDEKSRLSASVGCPGAHPPGETHRNLEEALALPRELSVPTGKSLLGNGFKLPPLELCPLRYGASPTTSIASGTRGGRRSLVLATRTRPGPFPARWCRLPEGNNPGRVAGGREPLQLGQEKTLPALVRLREPTRGRIARSPCHQPAGSRHFCMYEWTAFSSGGWRSLFPEQRFR
jgi:hypothetical protein